MFMIKTTEEFFLVLGYRKVSATNRCKRSMFVHDTKIFSGTRDSYFMNVHLNLHPQGFPQSINFNERVDHSFTLLLCCMVTTYYTTETVYFYRR